jgi:hypothetical protein
VGARPAISTDARPEQWWASSFGLALRLSFPVPGLQAAACDGRPSGPETVVELESREALEAEWPADEAERIGTVRHDNGRLAMITDEHPEAGYRMYAPVFGLYLIARDGSSVRCARPSDVADWNWQRLLLARMLPIAAALRGREVFHASAVRIRDRAVAIMAGSGVGKTSLAVNMVLSGAEFITDDVLALEATADGVLAHPGPPLASVRPNEMQSLSLERRRRLGSILGRAGKAYVSMPAVGRPLPLALAYLPERFTGASEAQFEHLDPPDPRLIIGSIFVATTASRQRLLNQLEVCAAVAEHATTYRVVVPDGMGAAELAARVEAHAEAHLDRGTA